MRKDIFVKNLFRSIMAICAPFSLLCTPLISAQVNTEVAVGTFSRSAPEVGFNLNSITKPSWNNRSFKDSVKSLAVPLLRYPGGTVSQYWDWRNGRPWPTKAWKPHGTLQNHAVFGNVNMVPHRLEDLKYATDYIGATPLFVLNILSDSLASQLAFLQYAKRIGLPVQYIELGNELYFPTADFTTRFPTAGDYAREMNVWIDTLRAYFPQAHIAILGVSESPVAPNGTPSPPRIQYWNDSLFTTITHNVDITFHTYIRHGNSQNNPVSITNTLANAFTTWQNEKSYTTDSLPPTFHAWCTEYNLNDNIKGNHLVATTWLHGLFTSIIHFLMLEDPKFSLIINHQITGLAPFASLDTYLQTGDTTTNRLTPEGNALRLIHNAERGKKTANRLTFSSNPNSTVGPRQYPSLLGWQFLSDSENELVILNISDREFTLSLSSLSESPFNFEQITSDTPTKINCTSTDLSIIRNQQTNQMNLPPYSLTRVILSKTNIGIKHFYLHDFSNDISESIGVHDLLGRKTFHLSGNNEPLNIHSSQGKRRFTGNGLFIGTIKTNNAWIYNTIIKMK